MRRDLWSSKNSDDKNDASAFPGGGPQDVMGQYGAMNQDQLMQELRAFRQNGQMDDAALEQMAQSVAPMLNNEQRMRLQAIMQQLKG